MKNCVIVCEYNPFHSGHRYQLDRVRESSVDNIICVMSGNFVQSALPAFCDKSIRAKCAVMGGADAVIELPTVFATASAQNFAEGAVKIMSGIKDVAYMAMGATSDPSAIIQIAEIKYKHADEFTSLLKDILKSGKSYNAASVAALSQIYSRIYPKNKAIDGVMSEPNNILCVEYLCALQKYAANVQPLIIKRRGAEYGDKSINGEHVSATAIREAEQNGNFSKTKKYIPFMFDEIESARKLHTPNIGIYKSMAVFALKQATTDSLKNLRDCSEGMEYLLKNMPAVSDFDRYVEDACGKRYGKKRIYRLFLDILLSIDKRLLDNSFCTRLLACKSDFDFTVLPDCVKTNNADIKAACAMDAQIAEVHKIDIAATALFNTISQIDGDYFNYSLIKL